MYAKKTAIVLCVMALCTGPSWVMAVVSDSGSGLDYKKKSSWKFWKSKPQAQKQDELFKKINKYIGDLNAFDKEIAEDLKVADSIHKYLETKNAKIPKAEKGQLKFGMREWKIESFDDAKKRAIQVQAAVQTQRGTYKKYLTELQKQDLEKTRLADIKKTTSGREKWLKAQRMEYGPLQVVLYGFHRDAKYMLPAKQQKVRQKRLDKIVNTDYFKELDAETQKVLQDARNVS